ncbi:hypothetical protein HHX47_DHR3000300 [Lentinula edodes]|nr:hypothetical protein HHX47_DHR3000300 [Lentinula edodes]
MEELLQMPCFRQVAGHQSAALATWFPKSYLEHQRINRELEEKLPHLQRNFDNSVYQRETRISVTQYTAGGIRRWLDYGGRTEEAFQAQDPEGFSIAWAKRREGWKESLQFFGTLEELKLNAL